MRVLVGFVGYSASTTKMIEQMKKFKQENLVQYKKIMKDINAVVLELICVLERCEASLCEAEFYEPGFCEAVFCKSDLIITLINKNRDLLCQLSFASGIELETRELKRLVDTAQNYGGAAKLSGAGGGDCGIAVCFDDNVAKNIMDEWACAGIKRI